MNNKDVERKLKDNYKDYYNNYIENKERDFPLLEWSEQNKPVKNQKKKDLAYNNVWKFSIPMDKEPATSVVRLALEGNPEAFFEACSHKEFTEKYFDGFTKIFFETIYGNGKLSILRYENAIRGYINEYYNNDENRVGIKRDSESKNYLKQVANQVARDRWRREREKFFYGPKEEYEEIETWKWLEENVLPRATLDVWESLHELYKPDAIVPLEDIEKFKRAYEDYCKKTSFKPVGNITISNEKSFSDKTPTKLVQKDPSKITEYKVFKQELEKQRNKITERDLYYAYYAQEKIRSFSTENDLVGLSQKASFIFSHADENVCRKFISTMGITCSEIDTKWQVIKQLFSGTIPASWNKIIQNVWEMALKENDYIIKMWVGFIADCGGFDDYIGNNIDFWLKFPEENVIRFLNIIRDTNCNIDSDDAIKMIYTLIYENIKNENCQNMWIRMRRDWIIWALHMDDKLLGISHINFFRQNYCQSKEEYAELIDAMFMYNYEMQNQKIQVNSEEYGSDNFIKSCNTVMRPIENMIREIDNLTTHENKNEMIKLKHIATKIKDNYTYFVDTWKR